MAGGLGERQGSANRRYYKAKGEAIYSDFITYAGSKKLAYCTAKEYYPHLEREGQGTVFEFGIGNGIFARKFLMQLREMCKASRKEGLFLKVRYVLHDVSPKMIEAAKGNLKEFGGIVEFRKFDAIEDDIEGNADYIRINELLSDLPAEVFVQNENGGAQKVKYGAGGTEIGREKAIGEEERVAKAVLSHFPAGYFVPINFCAGEFLLKASGALKIGGYIDIFDYGFANANDLLPLDMWNPSIVRGYGGQITVDLNFPYLSAMAKLGGFGASVELQREYVERVLGQNVHSIEKREGLEYYTGEEMKGSKDKRLESYGEDDAFYHLRVIK
jgi:SAM-dependent methyltransferase